MIELLILIFISLILGAISAISSIEKTKKIYVYYIVLFISISFITYNVFAFSTNNDFYYFINIILPINYWISISISSNELLTRYYNKQINIIKTRGILVVILACYILLLHLFKNLLF